MTKYILIMKICSVVHGDCLPEYEAGSWDSWYDCAAAGTMMTASTMTDIGEDLINNNKIYITFKCKLSSEA